MRPLKPDIEDFIRHRFALNDIHQVAEILSDPALTSTRVQRAVLYLSDGSLSMLKHFAESARADVRDVLVAAEYALGTDDRPIPVRSMSDPFPELPRLAFTVVSNDPSDEPVGPAPSRRFGPMRVDQRTQQGRFHGHLANSTFRLGKVVYVVTAEQFDPRLVRCYRQVGNVVSIVLLPLVFVLEQLSEAIEMEGVAY